jgi:alpha-ketoglutarate-dependent taurine dioxygenase
MLKYSLLLDSKDSPLLVEGSGSTPMDEIVCELSALKERLVEHGALLFRNFAVASAEDFDTLVSQWTDDHLKYVYRSTPRSEVTEHVVTSTSYPASLEIPLHNENAYHKQWPLTVAFCCLEAAAEGGQTPIAPMRAVTADIGEGLMETFERREVEYIRHYHQGVDLSWQSVFQTDSREKVHAYCQGHDIACEWIDGTLLRTSGLAQGVARHPITRDKVFFNQAHLFHVSSLGEAHASALVEMYGVNRLPRHARFGDGGEIPDADLRRVSDAFKKNEITFRWQKGDVLFLDNMAYAHGRQSFKGSRKILAALMDRHEPSSHLKPLA